MKKTKILVILLIILIILVVIYFVWQNVLESKSNQPKEQTLKFGNFANLQKIEITQAAKTTTLEKNNDNWLVTSENNAAANAQFVTNLIDGFKTLKSGLVISTNPDKQADFNLSADKATKIKLTDSQGQTVAELLIGKPNYPSYTQTYVRQPNSNLILLTSGSLYSLVNQTDWKQPPPKAADTNTNTTK